jgi:hypothetical protein
MTIRLAPGTTSALLLEERRFVGNLPNRNSIRASSPSCIRGSGSNGRTRGVHVATKMATSWGSSCHRTAIASAGSRSHHAKIVELTTSVSFDGRPIAGQSCGPVLIDRSARGRGRTRIQRDHRRRLPAAIRLGVLSSPRRIPDPSTPRRPPGANCHLRGRRGLPLDGIPVLTTAQYAVLPYMTTIRR